MLNRPRRSGPTVTNGSERLPSPLLIGLVECILQHTRDRVIVFGDHEYEAVIRASVFCQRNASAFSLGSEANPPIPRARGARGPSASPRPD